MKKFFALLTASALCFSVSSCGRSSPGEVVIDYGTSEIYSQQDMDAALSVIEDKFDSWKHCTPERIYYGGDRNCNDENIKWLNDLEAARDNEVTFTQVIMFKSDFITSENAGGAWNDDTEYTDWQWWLGRAEGGDWKLMTWGYG